MISTEAAALRANLIRKLVGMRWIALAMLFLAHVAQTRSLNFGEPGWQRMLAVLGFYAIFNILLYMLSPARGEPGSVNAVGFLTVAGDVVLLSLYLMATGERARGLGAALYLMPIIETGAIFGRGALTLTLPAAIAGLGFLTFGQVVGTDAPPFEVFAATVSPAAILLLGALLVWMLGRHRKAYTTELAENRQLTEAIVENLEEGILILDAARRLIFINPGGAGILGLQRKEVTGLKLHKYLSYPIRNVANLARVVDVQLPEGQQTELQLEHPEPKTLQITKTPLLDNQGLVIGQMLAIRDVSREEFLAKLKSDFISIAAHQLRTPLSSIKWAFAMMRDGGLGSLTQEQLGVVHQGLETTERLVRLVNSLLNVSRIEEGKFGYEIGGNVDPLPLIRNAMESLRQKAESQGVALEAALPPALPTLAADPEKLQLVLENLLDNAVGYTLAGGRVEIRAEAEEKFLRITVADTGVGIPQSQQKLLFSKFFRGDNVIRMQTEGSGLGLFIAKNIIERHGGHIALTSREGEGTTVSFTVPLWR